MLFGGLAGFHGLLMDCIASHILTKIKQKQSLSSCKGGAHHENQAMLFSTFAVYIKLAVSMSNSSVFERLERSLASYELGEISRSKFVRLLTDSIEALEGVPYDIRVELRTHEKNIETEGYYEDEGFQSKQVEAKANLRDWIKTLKGSYASGNC
jgi:hypothetical protein